MSDTENTVVAHGEIRSEGDTEPSETKRDRVRRLLLDPMGFRFPRGFDEMRAKKSLNRICDDLSYMRDESLVALRNILQSKGQGSARAFWPEYPTFVAFAESVQPRPVEELPALCSWFGSVEGPKSESQGILVETFLFIRDRKAPPISHGSQSMIQASARENRHRLELIRERRERGANNTPDDLAFERWYRDLEERCRTLMRAERQKRGHEV